MKCPETKDKYLELIEQVEKWSKFIVTFLKVALPCALLSRVAQSFFYYYVFDLGRDAFMLPVPMW